VEFSPRRLERIYQEIQAPERVDINVGHVRGNAYPDTGGESEGQLKKKSNKRSLKGGTRGYRPRGPPLNVFARKGEVRKTKPLARQVTPDPRKFAKKQLKSRGHNSRGAEAPERLFRGAWNKTLRGGEPTHSPDTQKPDIARRVSHLGRTSGRRWRYETHPRRRAGILESASRQSCELSEGHSETSKKGFRLGL